MFVLLEALVARGVDIGEGWAASLVMGAGQFCTNPGIAVVIEGQAARAFAAATAAALSKVDAQSMLTDGIAATDRERRDQVAGAAGVETLLSTASDGRQTSPCLCATSGETWLTNDALAEESFGPLGLIVHARDADEMLRIAERLHG